MTIVAVPDVLEEIAANAAGLDARPAFPKRAFEALTALERPATRADEWARVRAVGKADGSVGRLYEGHLNAQERLRLDGIDPSDHWLGVWGADPAETEGEPARIEGDALHGVKVFCSGAGGLQRALVTRAGRRSCTSTSQTSRSTRAGTAPAGCARRRATVWSSTARRSSRA